VELDEVYEMVREDKRWDHLRQPGIVLVKGRGQTEPTLCRAMIVGEAPGATENAQRRVFCGPSGKVLAQLMQLAGLSADGDPGCESVCHPPHGCCGGPAREAAPANCFITNVLKYRPPGNRTPYRAEAVWGAETLRLEWAALGRPPLLVAVGSTARAVLVPQMFGRIAPGKWVDLGSQVGQGPFVWVHFHPRYGISKPSARPEMERHWEEMGKWLTEN
jgi:DNA polymerase